MNFVNEIRERYDKNLTGVPVVKCEVFEDNSGAVETVHGPQNEAQNKTHQREIPSLQGARSKEINQDFPCLFRE